MTQARPYQRVYNLSLSAQPSNSGSWVKHVINQFQSTPSQEHTGPTVPPAVRASTWCKPSHPQPKLKQALSTLPRRLTVSKYELSKYRAGPYPEVIELVWEAGKLDMSVLSMFPNIQVLKCSRQNMDSIDAVAVCKELVFLNCSRNNLVTLGTLEACTKLTKIKCNRNQIISLIGLGSKLQTIKCKQNCLSSLEGLEQLPDLTYIDCSYNRIRTLGAVQACRQVETFICSNNHLDTLSGLEQLLSLQTLRCQNNWLTSIEAVCGCPDLEVISCNSNKLCDLKGLEGKTHLTHIDARSNRIKSLSGLAGCLGLKTLQLNSNRIRSTAGLGSSPSLESMSLGNNHLSELVLGLMPKLKTLQLEWNAIEALTGLVSCPALDYLNCNNNCIRSLKSLEGCPSITTLYCNDNLIDSLEKLSSLQNIQKLDCNQNRLVTLEGIEGCRRLSALRCRYNSITTLDHIIRLRFLQELAYDHNPIDRISPQVEHYLSMISERRRGLSIIYDNSENVSDDAVKDSVFKSIQNLVKDSSPRFSLDNLEGSGLSKYAIKWLAKSCASTDRSSEYLITFQQLLAYVWQRIQSSPHKSELIKVLEQQVTESDGRCLTGRMTRLLAVLMGFYDDIHIAISTNAQINAVIKVAERDLDPYCPKIHHDLVAANLRDLGYSDEEAKPWLDAIYGPEEAL